jgi:hypothetical protein
MMKTVAAELIGIWNSAYVKTSDVNHVTNRLLGMEIVGKDLLKEFLSGFHLSCQNICFLSSRKYTKATKTKDAFPSY